MYKCFYRTSHSGIALFLLMIDSYKSLNDTDIITYGWHPPDSFQFPLTHQTLNEHTSSETQAGPQKRFPNTHKNAFSYL